MRQITQNFWAAQEANTHPIVLVLLTSNMTRRLYSVRKTSDTEQGGSGGMILYDGAYTYGDDSLYGAFGLLADSGPRVLSFGSIRETLAPENNNLLASLNQTDIGSFSIEFDNADGKFSNILQTESFLNNDLEILFGFRDLAFSDFKSLFTGTIIEELLMFTKLRLVAQGNLDFKVIQANTPLFLTPYALRTTAGQIGATETFDFTTEISPIFCGSATWSCTIGFRRSALGSAGVLFKLFDTGYSVNRLEIGIDVSNHPYVTISRDVEASDSVTFTSTLTMVTADLNEHLQLIVSWNNSTSLCSFSLAGSSDAVDVSSAPNGFDRVYTNDGNEDLFIGYLFAGDIYSVLFGSTFNAKNTTGTTLSTDFPDIIGSLDVALDAGAWVKW